MSQSVAPTSDSVLPLAEARRRTHAIRVAIIAIVLLYVAVRAYLAIRMPVISRDGVTFIWYAQDLLHDPITTLRAQRQHPLFPITILVSQRVLDGLGILHADPARQWIVAGQLVPILCGLALLVAVYRLTRLVFDETAAVVAAAVAAILPELARYGVDVLTDVPHLALYMLGLACAAGGIVRRCNRRLLAAGAFSGLAYLTRPEGGEVVAITAAAALLWPGRSLRQRFLGAGVTIAAFLIIASPYMIVTGKIVQKKHVEGFVTSPVVPARSASMLSQATVAPSTAGMDEFASWRSSPFVRFGTAVGMIAQRWAKALRVMYLIPFVACVVLRRHRPPAQLIGWLLLGIAGLHVAVCLMLILRFDYWEGFSLRHALVLAALSLPFVGAGFVAIVRGSHDRLKARCSMTAVAIIAAVLIAAPTLPWLLRIPNSEAVELRTAGQWIKQHYGPHQSILTNCWRIAYYAQGNDCRHYADDKLILSPYELDVPTLITWVLRERPNLVALNARRAELNDASFFETLTHTAIDTGLLRHVHTIRDPKNKRNDILIYQMTPQHT